MAPRLPSPQRAPRSPLNRERTGAQRVSLLDALVECFPAALPYSRLREVAGLRPGARVDELKRAGWQVERVTLDQASKVCTYRLLSLECGEALQVHAAVTLYSDSAAGYHCRIHSDLSGRHSPEQLAQAAQAAQAAFRAALQRRERRPAPAPDVDLASLFDGSGW